MSSVNNKLLIKISIIDDEIINKDTGQIEPILDLESKVILDQNLKYFREYNKLLEANSILTNQLNNLSKEKNQLKLFLQKIESKKKKSGVENNITIYDTYTNRRRKRRTKGEIKRSYECSAENCKKSYGSEGSLNQHLKLKHKNIKI